MNLIIWDMLILEGNVIMFKAALGLLIIMQKDILAKADMEDLNNVFDSARYLNDYNRLIYYLCLYRFEFDYDILSKQRELFQGSIIDNIMKTNQHKFYNDINHKDKSNKIKRKCSYSANIKNCNGTWPICIYDMSYKYQIVFQLIYTINNPLDIIEDYYYGNNNNIYNKIKLNKNKNKSNDLRQEAYLNLLIERRPHCCIDEKGVIDNEDSHNTSNDDFEHIDKESLEREREREYKEICNFTMPKQENINYSKMLSNLDSGNI
jgi:hypothetical protein